MVNSWAATLRQVRLITFMVFLLVGVNKLCFYSFQRTRHGSVDMFLFFLERLVANRQLSKSLHGKKPDCY
ncbi:MAG: hypothetical protein C0613_11310 [Desulfobulbaceae bacterium]|nr:MAG: hypothetical protein C0613_11310 [Desulfobulbaceae bacterium]